MTAHDKLTARMDRKLAAALRKGGKGVQQLIDSLDSDDASNALVAAMWARGLTVPRGLTVCNIH